MTSEPPDAGPPDDDGRRREDEVPAADPGVEPIERDRLRPLPDGRRHELEDRDVEGQQGQQ